MKIKYSVPLIIMTIIFMDFLTGMEFDLFIPSFPEIQHEFNLSSFWVEAILSINFIGYCLGLFGVGNIADRYGRKPILLLGLLIFIMGSILCLWTHVYSIFLVGRFLQGIGIAAPSILSFLIIADNYPLDKQQFLLSMLNGAMNIAAALAPVMGSYITLYFHWEGNFVTLLILGLATLVMTWVFIPNYSLSQSQETPSLQGYISIFKSKLLMLFIIYFLVMSVPYWIFVGMSPLFFINALGVSLAHYGYYQGVLALIFAVGCIMSGFVIQRYDQKKILFISNLIFILSILSLSWICLINSHSALWITIAFIPFIIGQIAPSNILYPLCLEIAPEAKARSTAIMQGGRLIVSALSLQIAGYFYQGTFITTGILILVFILLSVILQFIIINSREINL